MSEAYVAYTRSFFRRWAPRYDLFAAPIAHAYRAAVRAAGPLSGRRLLDLCSGTGEVARRAAAAGARVVALDLTEAMLLRARRKLSAAGLTAGWSLGDARRLPFGDGAFDLVTLSFALHDMPRAVRAEVLREAARVARERLVVLDYELAGPPWLAAASRSAIALFESPYFRGFLRDGGVAAALAAAGLKPGRRRRAGPFFAVWTVEARRSAPTAGEGAGRDARTS